MFSVTISGQTEKGHELTLNHSRKTVISTTSPFLTQLSLPFIFLICNMRRCDWEMSTRKVLEIAQHFTFPEENCHLWAQKLPVSLSSSEEKGLLRQPPRDRLSHPGTTSSGHIACQGVFFTASVSGASAAAYESLIQSELYCPASVIVMLSLPDKIFVHIGKPIFLKKGHLWGCLNFHTCPDLSETPLSRSFANHSPSLTLSGILGAMQCLW